MWCWVVAALAAETVVQGVVSDEAGVAIDGVHAVTFTVTGGASPWTETQSVAFHRGAFAAALGAVNPLPNSLFATDAALAVTVALDGGPASAAVPVGWAPRALYAADAGKLGGTSADAYLRRTELGAGLSLNGSTYVVSPAYVDARVTAVGDARYVEPSDLSPGTGLTLSGSQFSVNQAYVDGRVTAVGDSRYLEPADVGAGLTLSGTAFSVSSGFVDGRVTAVGDARYPQLGASGSVSVAGRLNSTGPNFPIQYLLRGPGWWDPRYATWSVNPTFDASAGTVTLTSTGAPNLFARFQLLNAGEVLSTDRVLVRVLVSATPQSADNDFNIHMYDGNGARVRLQTFDNNVGGWFIDGHNDAGGSTTLGTGTPAVYAFEWTVGNGQGTAFAARFRLPGTHTASAALTSVLSPATGLRLELNGDDSGEVYRLNEIQVTVDVL